MSFTYTYEQFHYLSWENESIVCQVSELIPQEFCSLVNADVEVTLNVTQIQPQPSLTQYELSDSTPFLTIDTAENTSFMVSLHHNKSKQLHIKGMNLCCVVYAGFSVGEEAFNEKIPVSPICHKKSFFVDNEGYVYSHSVQLIDLHVYLICMD